MTVTIDRFERGFAVVEIGKGVFADLPEILVPKGAREGDAITITIDNAAISDRKSKIDELRKKLFED